MLYAVDASHRQRRGDGVALAAWFRGKRLASDVASIRCQHKRHASGKDSNTRHARRSCAHEAPAEGLAVQEKDDDAEDDGSVLSSLLDEMRPYVLRRVKAHVEKSVPPKEEIVVSVALAPLQKRYYRALYEKNVLMLAGTGRPVRSPRFEV